MIERLRKDGIAVLGDRFWFPPMLEWLDSRPRWNNHVKQGGEQPRPDSTSTCWSMGDVLNAPGWLEQALTFLPLAREYLGAEPLLYSVNCFVTYPNGGPLQADIQEFHRDADDVRFLALFVYLTDVLKHEDGPHQFAKGTQEGGQPEWPAETVFGPAGTMFLADTRGLHRGMRPTSGSRTLAWARFGVSDPPASYGWDKLEPCPLRGWNLLTQEQQRCCRLVAKEQP